MITPDAGKKIGKQLRLPGINGIIETASPFAGARLMNIPL